ncbi:hypothetical protein DFH94DRAFT_5043 [Russula ochroleuca]|uniref:Uncharacterized protein n=1 Tax=Russula ochroleuca TaxID=152965 RepID=A0A9P5N552_9AGAM|nr:hypothetical protein DFH94DRAFT_5043 [Russula ochroleuca]
MANLIRSAKSGSDWSVNELLAYRITISSLSPDQFFRFEADPSLDHMDPALFTAPPGASDIQLSENTAEYLSYLDIARVPTEGGFIDDFARETLRLLHYSNRNIILSTRYIIPLTICGETNRTAQTDMCLLHRSTLILLVYKTLSDRTDAEPQVVADAIAAFQFNNRKRESWGLVPLKSMTIPCITMSGTRPTFYLVPVSQALSTAVATGQNPPTETNVSKCVTALKHITGPHRYRASEGMEDTEYRKLALRRFLAFKMEALFHWVNIMHDVEV